MIRKLHGHALFLLDGRSFRVVALVETSITYSNGVEETYASIM
jgi:hypothetical protein